MSLQRQLRATFQMTVVLTGVLAVANAFPQTPEPSISALLAQAATYERQFEREFSRMVAQEHYEQRWVAFNVEPETRSDRHRMIESEVMFVWLQDEESWLTARNVRIVDDSPVRDSESRLERLLAAPTGDLVAQQPGAPVERRLEPPRQRGEHGPAPLRRSNQPFFTSRRILPSLPSVST